MAITPINSFDLPVNNADFDTWGTKLNTIFDSIDTLLGSPANTIKGNNTGSLAPTANLTAAQVAVMLPVLVGDSGSGGTKGLVPAPAAGDAAAQKVLGAGGGWVAPANPVKAGGTFLGSDGSVVAASGITLVRTGTGAYTATLSPAMPNANYRVQITLNSTFGTLSACLNSTNTTTSFSFSSYEIGIGAADPIRIYIDVIA